MDELIVECVVCPPIYNNTYILHLGGGIGCIVIDPSGDGEEIIARIQKQELCVELILLTHGHYDHISSLNNLIAHAHAPIAIHECDAEMLCDCTLNLSCYEADAVVASKCADKLLHDGDIIEAAGIEIKVLHTPGHSRGSCCFIVENLLFTGDTLFRLGAGRTDLGGGNTQQLIDSLQKLFNLEGDYTVLPGHMKSSTLEYERSYNVFMKNYAPSSLQGKKR